MTYYCIHNHYTPHFLVLELISVGVIDYTTQENHRDINNSGVTHYTTPKNDLRINYFGVTEKGPPPHGVLKGGLGDDCPCREATFPFGATQHMFLCSGLISLV